MKSQLIFIIFCIKIGSLFSACSAEKVSRETPLPPQEDLLREWHNELKAKPFFYGMRGSLGTVNGLPSNFYAKMVPKATIFADYNSGNERQIFLAAHFPFAFEKNLPSAIRTELRDRNLLTEEALSIAWVIQELENIGGNQDGATSAISYIKGHGWADKDAPAHFQGTRIIRDFLYGLFESNVDISYAVKNNELLPFSLHTHDSMYSPQTAAVHVPNKDMSIALWSLVIDAEPSFPEKPRAIATLHWLLSKNDMDYLRQEATHQGSPLKGADGNVLKLSGEIKFATFGDFVNFLKTSLLKESFPMQKLNELLKS